jgi:biotin operon repressor
MTPRGHWLTEPQAEGPDATPAKPSAGETNSKFPSGVERQIQLLKDEGHQISRKPEKFYVENFQDHLNMF